MAILPFQFIAKHNLGLFLCRFSNFGLVFSDLSPCFCFYLPSVFLFCLFFLPNAFQACFSVELLFMGLFLRFTCLFLQNNLVWQSTPK